MKNFRTYLTELAREIPWVQKPNVGWWREQKVLRMYHGTNKRNLPHILKDGISRFDPSTGLISMAFEPNTAFGYAAMSGAGGEADFRKAGARPVNTPANERVVFVFDLPMDWILQNYDKSLSGNTPPEKRKLQDASLYEPGHDFSYYALTELRFSAKISPMFLIGYMLKSK